MSARQRIVASAAIFIVSFAVKSLHAADLAPYMYTREQPYVGLTDDYEHRASRALEGKGILFPRDWNPADTGMLSHAPGYSIYLSAIYAAFGRSFFTVQAVQNLLNSVSAVLIFFYGGLLLSWRVGLAAGMLAAVSHHFSYYSNLILPDSICVIPVLIAAYLLTASEDQTQGGWFPFAAAGAALGLSSWLRPNAMLMSAFLGLMLVMLSVRRHRLWQRVLLLVVASWVVIAPITIRNYVVYREIVPIQIGTGLNLWEGIGESSGDRFGAVAKDEQVAEQEARIYNNPDYGGWWASPDGIQRDRNRVSKSLAIIRSNPIWYAGVMLDRMAEMTKYSAYAPLVSRTSNAPDQRIVEEKGTEPQAAPPSRSALILGEGIAFFRPIARAAQRIAKETALFFVLLGGVILAILDWRKAFWVMIVPLYYFSVQSAMHTEFRYILAMHYFLFVFAAVVWVLIAGGIIHGARRLVGRRSAEEPGTPEPADVRPF